MISPECRQGAVQAFVFHAPAVAKMWHARCKGGTWCDCQCVTDQSAINPDFIHGPK